jgi:predicted aspartyl protease
MKRLGLGFVLLAALAALPARAEDCGTLKTISSVALQPSETRLKEYVPVKINGVDKRLVLDTGGYTSQITLETTEALKLPVGGGLGTMKYIGGSEIAIRSATISDFEMGSMRARNLSVLVSPIPGLAAQADGLLASDLFLAYDIDMDFGHDKLNFISSDHCPGKVIYWQAQALAEIPLRIVNGHYLIDITLDGKRLVAMIDTGSPHSSIGLAEAQRYFSLSPASPDMLMAAKANGSVTTYMRKFGVLSFEGIEIHDPNIAVLQTDLLDRERASAGAHVIGQVSQPWDMTLGMDVLRHLHVYIATKERKLYITPA